MTKSDIFTILVIIGLASSLMGSLTYNVFQKLRHDTLTEALDAMHQDNMALRASNNHLESNNCSMSVEPSK